MLSIENVVELNQYTETTKWVTLHSFVVEQAASAILLLKDK